MRENFIPNSFQIPNQIIDVFMPLLSEMELKFYLFIMRKTKGWQKESDGISISQFLKGAQVKDERTVRKAIKGLLKKDLIFQTFRKGSFSIFSINLNPNPLHADEGTHGDVPPTNSCANPPHDNVGTPPSSTCTPQKTLSKSTNTKTTNSRARGGGRDSFSKFKSEFLQNYPNFHFCLGYPNEFGYYEGHHGFMIRNDLIFDLEVQKFISKEDASALWGYIFNRKEQFLAQAQAQTEEIA